MVFWSDRMRKHARNLDADGHDTTVVLNMLGGKEVVNTVTAAGATETLDLADGNWHDVTLTENCTFTLTGATDGVGCSMLLILRQDGTGSRTVTWPASVEWPGGVAPTLSTDANAVDIISLLTEDGGTTWFGAYQGGSGGIVDADDIRDAGYWSPLTNGDSTTPELVFADGDTIAVWTET